LPFFTDFRVIIQWISYQGIDKWSKAGSYQVPSNKILTKNELESILHNGGPPADIGANLLILSTTIIIKIIKLQNTIIITQFGVKFIWTFSYVGLKYEDKWEDFENHFLSEIYIQKFHSTVLNISTVFSSYQE
jgi:hypothetical protein